MLLFSLDEAKKNVGEKEKTKEGQEKEFSLNFYGNNFFLFLSWI